MAVDTAEEHASALEEEQEAEDSDDEGHSESTDSGNEGSSAHEANGKKKKKKKKKKKSGSGGSGTSVAPPPPVDPAARKEADRRLQEAVELLSHNSEDGMWVRLSGCHLADTKLRKLCEALRSNTNCISLDLSANQLSDEGAKALAAALADGHAPDLIDLDLRGNPQIRADGTAALEELQQQRKTLRVALGPIQPPAPQPQPPTAANGKPGSPKSHQHQHQQQQLNGGEPHMNGSGGGGSLAETVKNNPVISKYFAVGNDEAEEAEEQQQQQLAAGEGGEGGGGLSAAELAHILWDQLEQCLDAPQPEIPAISEPLRAIAEQVEHEMDNCALPMLPSTEVSDLRTFTQWALRKLHVLHSVLDLVPPPVLTPYSKTKPVPAVGTHRAAVAELLAQLLRGECAAIARAVAASGLLRRCAAVAAAHPNCSVLHGAVVRCLRLSLSQSVGHVGLWRQLLGSSPAAAAGGAASEDRGSSLNLAAEAAAVAASAAGAQSVGKRATNVGFALAVAQILHQAATGELLGNQGVAAAAAVEAAAAEDREGREQQPQGAQGEQTAQQQAGASQQAQQPSPAGEGQQRGDGREQNGRDAPDSRPMPLERNPLAPRPGDPPRRSTSQASLGRLASGAFADLPEEGASWGDALRARLAATEAWVAFSDGADAPLRQLFREHEGDLGAPRPRPVAEQPQEDEEMAGSGQIISGQELLMMLRGLNLGGFGGGI